jgi:hypothetical protein
MSDLGSEGLVSEAQREEVDESAGWRARNLVEVLWQGGESVLCFELGQARLLSWNGRGYCLDNVSNARAAVVHEAGGGSRSGGGGGGGGEQRKGLYGGKK